VAIGRRFNLYDSRFRRCRSELHTTRGRKRKVRIFEPSRGFDTPLSMPLKIFRFLCRSPSHGASSPGDAELAYATSGIRKLILGYVIRQR
jgi:hypothetical protein